MNFDDYKTLKFDRRGRVLTITLNRPDKLNSLAGEAHTELSHVFYDVVEDKDSDIIVVTGAGKAFSAGGDIEHMQWLRDNPPAFYQAVREAKRIVSSLLECDKPIIAKVNGDAIGLGSTLAVFCDVIFAADTARFGPVPVELRVAAQAVADADVGELDRRGGDLVPVDGALPDRHVHAEDGGVAAADGVDGQLEGEPFFFFNDTATTEIYTT